MLKCAFLSYVHACASVCPSLMSQYWSCSRLSLRLRARTSTTRRRPASALQTSLHLPFTAKESPWKIRLSHLCATRMNYIIYNISARSHRNLYNKYIRYMSFGHWWPSSASETPLRFTKMLGITFVSNARLIAHIFERESNSNSREAFSTFKSLNIPDRMSFARGIKEKHSNYITVLILPLFYELRNSKEYVS